MSGDAASRGTSTHRDALLRRLSDARAILGCGDDADRRAAIEELARLERALDLLGGGHEDASDEPDAPAD